VPKIHTEDLIGIQAPAHYPKTFCFTAAKKPIHLRKVFCDQPISDPHLDTVLLFLKPPPKGQKLSELLYSGRRRFVKQELALGYQIGNVGRTLAVVFVPAPIQQLSVVFDHHPGDQHDIFITSDQMGSQRFVIVACWFHTEYGLIQSVLIPDGIDMGQKFVKSFYCVFKDQSP